MDTSSGVTLLLLMEMFNFYQIVAMSLKTKQLNCWMLIFNKDFYFDSLRDFAALREAGF